MSLIDRLTTQNAIFFLLILVIPTIILSCNRDQVPKESHPSPDLNESLIKANQKAVDTETEQINDYLRRHEWKTLETGSGLRYWIYRQGNGEPVTTGDVIEIEYIVSLLNGDTAYTSRENGPLVFISGNAQVISGLEEGILLLKQGDHAKFIIPSHLAYGLIGDQDKIGKKATLVYDVKVLRIKKNKH